MLAERFKRYPLSVDLERRSPAVFLVGPGLTELSKCGIDGLFGVPGEIGVPELAKRAGTLGPVSAPLILVSIGGGRIGPYG